MRKALIIMFAVVLLVGTSGCVSITISKDTETPPAQKTELSITQNAQYHVNLANARNIATGINAYNALNPDNVLPDDVTLEQAKEALDDLWPARLSDKDARAAWELIEIKDGVADIKE